MRRWPVVTAAIIVACAIVHAVVFARLEAQEREIGEIEARITSLKTRLFAKYAAGGTDSMLDQTEPRTFNDFLYGAGARMDLFMQEFERGGVVSKENADYRLWANLNEHLETVRRESVARRFAYLPAAPTWYAGVTASFLHGGLLHLLGNMFFLFLVGPAIEDRWGRPVFLAFYLAGGAVALWVQGLVTSDPTVPVLGASGAIAGVMGAFAVRFGKKKIRFWYAMMIAVRAKTGVFELPAWLVLGTWLVVQAFGAVVLGAYVPIGYAAHVAGFAFGAVFAGFLAVAGLEDRLLAPLIERKLEAPEHRADPRLLRAHDLLARGDAEPALDLLYAVLGERPGDVTVKREMLRGYLALGRSGDAKTEGADVVGRLVEQGREDEAADVYREIAGTVPDFSAGARPQLAVARWLERNDLPDEAARAFRELAVRWPDSELAPKALVSAADIAWRRCDDPDAAFRILRRFVEKYPDHPLADHARARMTRITGGQVVFK